MNKLKILFRDYRSHLIISLILFIAAGLAFWDMFTEDFGVSGILSVIAVALATDVINRALVSMKPQLIYKLKAFYTNRKESSQSWVASLEKTEKKLIVVGATAETLLINYAEELKKIASTGEVIIVVPRFINPEILKLYEKSIHGSALEEMSKASRVRYADILKQLKNEGYKNVERRMVMIEHAYLPTFGATLFDPDEPNGKIRLEVYGQMITQLRPSFDVTKDTNRDLYENILGTVKNMISEASNLPV